jgi:hypothetical protein
MRVTGPLFNPSSRSPVGPSKSLNRWPVLVISEVVKRILLVLVLLVAVVYLGDYLRLRYRMATNRDAFGSVTRDVFYSVKLKNGKTEFSYGGQQDFECPNSLLPEYWEKPCWLARRQKEVEIVIDSGNPNNPKLY